jgi:hypothetical protein
VLGPKLYSRPILSLCAAWDGNRYRHVGPVRQCLLHHPVCARCDRGDSLRGGARCQSPSSRASPTRRGDRPMQQLRREIRGHGLTGLPPPLRTRYKGRPVHLFFSLLYSQPLASHQFAAAILTGGTHCRRGPVPTTLVWPR